MIVTAIHRHGLCHGFIATLIFFIDFWRFAHQYRHVFKTDLPTFKQIETCHHEQAAIIREPKLRHRNGGFFGGRHAKKLVNGKMRVILTTGLNDQI